MEKSYVTISIDVEKAFDIQYPFLIKTLMQTETNGLLKND